MLRTIQRLLGPVPAGGQVLEAQEEVPWLSPQAAGSFVEAGAAGLTGRVGAVEALCSPWAVEGEAAERWT